MGGANASCSHWIWDIMNHIKFSEDQMLSAITCKSDNVKLLLRTIYFLLVSSCLACFCYSVGEDCQGRERNEDSDCPISVLLDSQYV